jgi:hypothetical protein
VSILGALKYPNRVVAILTPIISPLVGTFTTWIADKVPGISKGSLDEIFIAGSVIALAPALHWLQGRAKWDILQEQQRAAGVDRSAIDPATPEEFEALGIDAPETDIPDPDTEAPDAAADDDLADDGVDDDDLAEGEDGDADIDGDADFLDDEEELEGTPEPQPIAGR